MVHPVDPVIIMFTSVVDIPDFQTCDLYISNRTSTLSAPGGNRLLPVFWDPLGESFTKFMSRIQAELISIQCMFGDALTLDATMAARQPNSDPEVPARIVKVSHQYSSSSPLSHLLIALPYQVLAQQPCTFPPISSPCSSLYSLTCLRQSALTLRYHRAQCHFVYPAVSLPKAHIERILYI